jgi:hypothetical protein
VLEGLRGRRGVEEGKLENRRFESSRVGGFEGEKR